MTPIEKKLYDAMVKDGLMPIPQFHISGYFVDFAFPDVRLAVEADGVEFHSGERRERDRKRDWILRQEGWTVKRFYGSTIHNRAENCVYIIKRELAERRRPPPVHQTVPVTPPHVEAAPQLTVRQAIRALLGLK